jgi:murein tripeptide amidase MpaA
MAIKISNNFDGGAIEVLRAEDAAHIELNIRKDSHADITQWFYFRLQGAKHEPCSIRLLNAGKSTYPEGWEGYQAVASYDRETWFRVPTTFDGACLHIEHTPSESSVYYAMFEPYPWDRHLKLVDSAQCAPRATLLDLGSSVEGRDMNVLVLGNEHRAAHKVWIIARQHPGETMAEWFVEGMLQALLDAHNPWASKLLQNIVFYIVPNMNPDGSVHGNLRTNAAGANLNREWQAPTMARSPEVFLVRKKMQETGCDLFLDVHGDEALPYVFAAGSESLESFSAAQQADQDSFLANFKNASPDFQDVHGYPKGKFSPEVLTMASPYVTHTFGCLSLTLELPFKDNANDPNPQTGWNGARSANLGRAVLQPIWRALQERTAQRK